LARLLIIGWDGADWSILDDLIARGDLPNVERIIGEGARGTLLSPRPDHSWAAWPTFLTGMNPGAHGVFDFMERHRTDTGKRDPIFSSSIRATTFLETLSDAGHEVRAGNVPVTFPPIPVRGRMISGGSLPSGVPFVSPSSWADHLKSVAPFPINGMEWARYRDHPYALLQEAREFVEARTASFVELLQGSWSVAVCVYVVTDRLQHPFADHLIPSHPAFPNRSETPLAEAVRDVYRLLDAQVQRLQAEAGDATTLLVSDHGFAPVTRAANLDAILMRQGFAASNVAADAVRAIGHSRLWRLIADSGLGRTIREKVRTPATVSWGKTAAYCSVTGGGVSVNLKGREPAGIVEPKDRDRVLEEVRDALLGFEDPELGKPIAEVLRSEEIFSGRFASLAPDLIAVPDRLWVLDHTDEAATVLDYPTGDHRREGVIAAAGGGISPGDLGVRDLADVAPTALAMCGVPSSGLDGRVVETLAGDRRASAVVQVPDAAPVRESVALSEEETESVAEHLRALGYID
jgi:predicted AlkP superfamily phosphohydrolase/phosphomutase